MPIGFADSASYLNGQLGQLAVDTRGIAQRQNALFLGIQGLGADDTARAAALEAKGYTAGEAAQVLYVASVFNTLATVYYGDAGQTPPFDFDDCFKVLRGTRYSA